MNIPCPMCLENNAQRKHPCPQEELKGLTVMCECCEECSQACEDEFDEDAHEDDVVNFFK